MPDRASVPTQETGDFGAISVLNHIKMRTSVIITWCVCYSACAKVLCFTITNKHMGDRSKRMSCPPRRFVDKFCQLREKKMEKWNENAKQTGICMMLRLLKWIRRENS